MKKFTTLVAMLLIFAASYAQEKFEKGDTKTRNGKVYTFVGYTTEDGMEVENWARKTVEKSEEYSSDESTSSKAQASSATATTGYTIDDLVKLMAIAKGMNNGDGNPRDADLERLEREIEALKLQNQQLQLQLAAGSGKKNKGDNTNKIVKADLAFDVIDTGIDAVSLGFQLSDWIKNRGGNGNGFIRGNQTRGTTDWGYGDLTRTGTRSGRTAWNNGR